MNDLLPAILALPAGAALGFIFFGGLWWTVRKGLTSKWPALLFLGSLLLRAGVAVAGFYLVGHGHWERLLACLLGFIAARLIVTRLVRPAEKTGLPPREADRAH
jgi:F1F0 ATPase subunit 2